MSCFGCCGSKNSRCRSRSTSSRRRTQSPFALKEPSTISHRTPLQHLAQIFEDLKCPICFNLCVPPIHNCVNGHIICNACRHRGSVTSCPTCRSSLVSSCLTRNRFAENFIQNYTQRCRYDSQGCEHLRLKGQCMKSHEEHCMFRPMRCLIGTCRQKIPYKSYLGHLINVHQCMGTHFLPATVRFNYTPPRKPNKVPSGSSTWSPFIIQAFDNAYFVMMSRIGSTFWFWVYIQASREGDVCEHDYSAVIKLRHPDRKMSLTWQGPVYCLRTPFKDIQTEGCAFTVPHHLIRNFATTGTLRLTVDIRQTAKRSLNGVTLPGEGDSDTAVTSEVLPQEYQRPPSFYQPSGMRSGENGNGDEAGAGGEAGASPDNPEGPVILDPNGNPVIMPKGGAEDEITHTPATVPPRRRMPAIGIPSGFPIQTIAQPPSAETSFLDMTRPPAELFGGVTSNEEGDEDDEIFNDKVVAYLSMTIPRN